MTIDFVYQFVEYDTVPMVQSALTATNQFHCRIQQSYGMGPLARLRGICRCSLLADLPLAPDFVSEAPELDIVRLIPSSILSPQVCPVSVANSLVSCLIATTHEHIHSRISRTITVFHPVQRVLERPCTHVEDNIRLDFCQPAPSYEPAKKLDQKVFDPTIQIASSLIRAELIALLPAPCQLWPPLPLLLWPNPVLPVVRAHIVSARPSHHRHAELIA